MVVVVHPAPVQPNLPAGHGLDLEDGGAQPGEDELEPPARGEARVHPVSGRSGQINVVVAATKTELDLLGGLKPSEMQRFFLAMF